MNDLSSKNDPRPRLWRRLLGIILGLLLLLSITVGGLLWNEIDTSRWQARYLGELGRQMRYEVGSGPSDSIRFPSHGPFDERLGYVALPQVSERLAERGFEVTTQARISSRMAEVVDFGLFAPYREKTQAGLTVLGCAGEPLFSARYPERVYVDFELVPRLLTDSLLFIENRELLSNEHPSKNPAIEWDRFIKAALDQLVRRFQPEHEAPGGSTLATQIEKYRHSPNGRTVSGEEKLRQMASASLRAYLEGEDTTAVRRRLVVDYLNTVPLAAWPGHGEVIGLGDGLWVWYGRDFDEMNQLLRDESAPLADRALAYKQALSLMVSQRRPSGFLIADPSRLEQLTDTYLRLMADARVVPATLRDAALAQPLVRRQGRLGPPQASFVDRKVATTLRTHVAGLVGQRQLYELDRTDLVASSTIDARLQQAVVEQLRALADPKAAAAAGLMGERLLANSDPSKVLYGFTLFERTEHVNAVRVQADTLDQPFDINEGIKLDLGSTAKLRTLVTYLEIVARLHERLSPLGREQLKAVPVASNDAIGRWVIEYLRDADDEARDLRAMLEAAMERRYSASPAERFFTGGGMLTFRNFDPADDGRVMTVREGMQRSVNLLFIRLMRDIVRHTISELPTSSATLLDDADDPKRQEYLARFADQEGSVFLRRFYRKYQGLVPAEAEALLLQGIHPTPRRLATVFRTLAPEADEAEFEAFLRRNLPEAQVPEATVPRLYRDYAVERYGLADRGYIVGVHPLELWLVGFLRSQPEASLQQVLDASRTERQEVYSWLFKTRRKGAQDSRIRTMVELEAFLEIHRMWQRLGYPFESLTPSYATSLGSSADRPAALAELVGILLNDGVRLPTLRVDALHFAAGTPYETRLDAQSSLGVRVLPVEVARTALSALAQVVESGTARRLNGVFTGPDGVPLAVGGKTGTGDHRFQSFGQGGALLSSRVVSRSGTFVFFIGERHFGTLTAYVKGPDAARYQFTSALPTQILKTLAPLLAVEINREERVGTSCAADAPLRSSTPTRETEGPQRRGLPAVPAAEALDTVPELDSALPDVPVPEANTDTLP
jgi:membrane peptidoglycan carboxypeptidase